jgi:peptide/nickel transport system substrate-binding protein
MTMEWTVVTQDEYWKLILKNAHDGAIVTGSGGFAAILEPEFFVPATFENIDQAFYAIPWARWFIDPRTPGAEPPPPSVVKQMELFRQVLTEPNREARVGLMARVLEMAADEFYVMGICLEPDRFAIRTPGFRNVPASHFDSYLYPDPGPFNPCQFFLESSGASGR